MVKKIFEKIMTFHVDSIIVIRERIGTGIHLSSLGIRNMALILTKISIGIITQLYCPVQYSFRWCIVIVYKPFNLYQSAKLIIVKRTMCHFFVSSRFITDDR